MYHQLMKLKTTFLISLITGVLLMAGCVSTRNDTNDEDTSTAREEMPEVIQSNHGQGQMYP
jgi:protein involved in sex pheromone biosynthesis